MLHIDREKFQLFSTGKIFKSREYTAYLEAESAVDHAYRENNRLIQNASQLCEQLVQDTNTQVATFVGQANENVATLLAQANDNAKKIIDQANEKSTKILAEAQEKRTEIFEEAKKYYANEAKRGYDDGYATGKSEMAQQLVEIAAKNSENINQLESSIVGLVLKALKRILGEVSKETLIVDLVRQALKLVKNQQEAILKVSPADAQAVRDHMEQIMADGIVDYLEVTADSRLKPGTCILETDIGVVDASLDVQLQAITDAFQKIQGNKKITDEDAEPSDEQSETSDSQGEVADPVTAEEDNPAEDVAQAAATESQEGAADE